MEKAPLNGARLEIDIAGSFEMINGRAMGFIPGLMARCMKVSGMRINNMDRGRWCILKGLSRKGYMRKVNLKAKSIIQSIKRCKFDILNENLL